MMLTQRFVLQSVRDEIGILGLVRPLNDAVDPRFPCSCRPCPNSKKWRPGLDTSGLFRCDRALSACSVTALRP